MKIVKRHATDLAVHKEYIESCKKSIHLANEQIKWTSLATATLLKHSELTEEVKSAFEDMLHRNMKFVKLHETIDIADLEKVLHELHYK